MLRVIEQKTDREPGPFDEKAKQSQHGCQAVITRDRRARPTGCPARGWMVLECPEPAKAEAQIRPPFNPNTLGTAWMVE